MDITELFAKEIAEQTSEHAECLRKLAMLDRPLNEKEAALLKTVLYELGENLKVIDRQIKGASNDN